MACAGESKVGRNRCGKSRYSFRCCHAPAAFTAGSCHVIGMKLADFVHLRIRSAYSLSSGAIKIKELVKLCRAGSMPAVAITDTGNLLGALEFAISCTDAGIQPIIGIEIALAPGEIIRGDTCARRGRSTDMPSSRTGSFCWRRARPAIAT